MSRLFFWLIILAVSICFGLLLVEHPGYVFIVAKPWMIQMPLWFAAVGLFAVFALFYFCIDSIERIQFWWYRVKSWWRLRREHKSYSKTQHGLALLIEGRYSKAERLLLQGVNQHVDPLMNYLGAARAAHALKAYDRAAQYLKEAKKVAPHAELAIGLTQAEFQIEEHQLELAVTNLNHLRQLSRRHPAVLRLLEKVYVRLGAWEQLRDLLPEMRKAKIFTDENYTHFERTVYSELLRKAGKNDKAELDRMWNSLPRAMRRQPEVVLVYVQQLQSFGDQTKAEDLIRSVLRYEWQPDLMKIYSTLTFDNLNRQLVIAGAWLKMYGQKPEITLFLGKVCARIQLWGKAKDYFEKCLEAGPNAEAALEYGRLLEQLNDKEEAVIQYREVLKDLAER